MNWNRLTIDTAPASKPVTTAEAKSQMRIDTSDDDTYIDALIDSAVGLIDGPRGIGICMVSQIWTLTLDDFPTMIRLGLGPLISVDSITYIDTAGDSQTLAAANYRVVNAGDLATIEPVFGGSWPATRDIGGAVVVTFTAGHTTVPAVLKQAVLLMVAQWYRYREPADDAKQTPPGVAHILGQFRAGAVAG